MAGNAFLVCIRSAPDEVESMEMLELILAGASLEVDLTVLFEGLGVGHLRAPWAKMWQQLSDYQLATLCMQVEAGEPLSVDLPVRRVDGDALDELSKGRSCLDL